MADPHRVSVERLNLNTLQNERKLSRCVGNYMPAGSGLTSGVNDIHTRHHRGGAMTRAKLVFDPFSEAHYSDPYETYRRLRDEAPVYYNEQYDFYALAGTRMLHQHSRTLRPTRLRAV
jgi:hypothetical protein